MEITLLQQPDSAIIRVLLDATEEVITQTGSMISMSNSIEVSTIVKRSSNKEKMLGIPRILGGESLFLTTFKATTNRCEVILAPTFLGDLLVYDLTKYKLVVQTTCFLACTAKVDLFLGFRGFKKLLDQESIYWLSATGKGKVILHSFGAIYEVMVDGDYIVDLNHLVAFENSLEFKVDKTDKKKMGALFKQDKPVCRFHGQGKVFCQTHHPSRFGTLLGRKL
jgi:uncharacterized protein (TIGR00266 family)